MNRHDINVQQELRIVDNAVCHLVAKWYFYNHLFESQENCKVMNQFDLGYNPFALFQEALLRDVIVEICSLLEGTFTSSKKEVTLKRLIRVLEEDSKTGPELESLKQDIQNLNLKPLVEYRGKMIAHKDLDTFRGYKTKPTLNKNNISKIVESVMSVFDRIHQIVNHNSSISFSLLTNPRPAEWIIESLRQANRYHDLLFMMVGLGVFNSKPWNGLLDGTAEVSKHDLMSWKSTALETKCL